MKNLLKGLLAALFVAMTGIAMADDGHPDDHAKVIVVTPVRHYHYWHHRRYYYDEHHHRHYDVVAPPPPRNGVSLNVGIHN